MRLIRLIDNWWECEICGDLYRFKKDALLWCGSNCAHLKANKKIHVVNNPSLNRALGGLNMTPKGLCDYILSGKIYDHIPSGDSNSEEMDRYIWPARMKHLVELAKIAYPREASIEHRKTIRRIRMIESKYLDFDKIGNTGKTEIWNVLPKSSDFILGQIKWYWSWRQYCFCPSPNCVIKNTCMSDIQKMIDELMDRRKK